MNKRSIILVSVLSVLIVVSLIFVLDLMYRDTNATRMQILDVKILRLTKNGFQFIFENPYHEKLKDLRNHENLDKVVQTAKNDFEKILLLKDWTRQQWEPCSDFPVLYPPWDALVILDWIRSGKTGGFCGQYGVVFAQSLMSLDIPVRYLDISDKDGNGHFLTEVWSSDFNKWVVMDPYFDIHFEKNNIPLNALELHNAACSGGYENIEVIKGSYVKNENYNKVDLIKYYYFFKIFQRTDHFSHPISIALIKNVPMRRTTVNQTDTILQWRDVYTMRCLNVINLSSSDRNDFYYKPDRIYIEIKDKNYKKNEMTLKFKRLLTPEKKFSIQRDSDRKWETVSSTFVWKLHRGYNRLYVTPEEIDLNEGYIQSYIAVQY